jgi:hypothetical protein
MKITNSSQDKGFQLGSALLWWCWQSRYFLHQPDCFIKTSRCPCTNWCIIWISVLYKHTFAKDVSSFYLTTHSFGAWILFLKLSLCLTKHHAMKAYSGSGGTAPHILDLGTRWRWVVSFMPWLLYSQGKCPWYPLDRRLGGPQSHSGHSGREKNSQPPTGDQTLEPPSSSP